MCMSTNHSIGNVRITLLVRYSLNIKFEKFNILFFNSIQLDFTSGSGFCQWIWILSVGLDLPVGLDMKTPWARLPAVSCDLHTTMA